MKCVCGYERDWKLNDDGGMDCFGDEDFIALAPEDIYDRGFNYKFNLYVCPKCGTVRAEKYY